mmetsp:Transcript_11276/g.16718  ORF Transcript_11276/g.16718 Transcript_11276/m.16718 type:complete len:216 (-) Transcript_11276:47-694(-)|eukprot:CAMPEP_0206579932 /NCGR_PEP_ID=MMETSP0325_2-20121206/32846_1 /ASSEMBLY_ACC=CAM_ASM_000347 /TAXON_ID=2866 /ORGANISM="Crypthecodinium cohnii, Strain Seligo" /LENGTH=215 /DNA_ID=CAMNT_0054085843 /DNA_START=210 /DNA_END=857 /DNA_ORIENTATION=+
MRNSLALASFGSTFFISVNLASTCFFACAISGFSVVVLAAICTPPGAGVGPAAPGAAVLESNPPLFFFAPPFFRFAPLAEELDLLELLLRRLLFELEEEMDRALLFDRLFDRLFFLERLLLRFRLLLLLDLLLELSEELELEEDNWSAIASEPASESRYFRGARFPRILLSSLPFLTSMDDFRRAMEIGSVTGATGAAPLVEWATWHADVGIDVL